MRTRHAACCSLAALLLACSARSTPSVKSGGAASAAGLVAGYAFSEGFGTTTADVSPNHLTGTISGATWAADGHSGTALSFDGASSYVDLGNPAALALTGSLTVSAWVNESADTADDAIIVAKSSGTGGAGWELKSSPDTGFRAFAIGVYGAGGAYSGRYTSAARTLGAWYHVAGVYDAAAGALHVYVNGVLDDGALLGTVPASLSNPPVNASIGRRDAGFFLDGTIDDVRIYARALSQAEIQADMASPVDANLDTTPPTAPTGLVAAALSWARIELSWTASTDDVGVAGYRIYRDGTQVGTSTTTAWSDTGVAPSTSYVYAVSAYDAGGNESARSATASATTPDVPFDFSLAGPPSGTVAQGGSFTGTITLGLVQGTSQPVTLGATELPAGVSASFTPASCTPPCTSTLALAATPTATPRAASVILSAGGGGAGHTAGLALAVSGTDAIAPTVALTAPADGAVVGGAPVALSATAADDVGVAGVTFLLDGAPLGSEVTAPPYDAIWDTTGASAGAHLLSARARDATGNTSLAPTVSVTVDHQAPAISSVVASGMGGASAVITWVTDERATSQVEYGRTTSLGALTPRDDALVLSHRVTLIGLAPSATYYYRVRSIDAAGNEQLGTSSSFRTTASSDTTPPSVPAGLTAAGASATSVKVAWSASSDAVGVAGYRVQRDGAQIATVPIGSFVDAGLAPATTHAYAVSAYDAAGNVSALSAPVSGSTLPDTTPPAAPGALAASAVSQARIDLSWSAATDDVGVVGYEVRRDGAVVATATGTSWSDTGLAPFSTHAYTVAARDAAGNLSAPSAPASATTPDVTVAVTPATATVPQGLAATLGCAVGDPAGCTWSVLEGAAGGTVTASGSTAATYTAPHTPGTYHVVATSVSTPRASGSTTLTVPAPPPSAFPVAFDSSGRYLVDAAGSPWRIQADAGWVMSAAATPTQVDTYLADRRSRGFNAFYLHSMVHAGGYFAPATAPANYAGDVPFTTPGDFSTPNEPYWKWIDLIIDKAAAQQMEVVLAFAYLGWSAGITGEGWGQEVQAMSQAQATAWGTWLGNRYGNRPNVLWFACGDYRPPAGSTLESNVIAMIQGIKATGAAQLFAAELNLPDDVPSLDAPSISSAAGNMTDSFYGWGPWNRYDVYATADEAFREPTPLPAWVQEGIYEGEEDLNLGLQDLVWTTRRNRFWSVLAGGLAGDGFGSHDVWRWVNFPAALSSPGSVQSSYAFALLASVPWWDLRPSGIATGYAGRTLVTSGGGTCTSGDTACVTSAVSGDGAYLLAYYPGQDGGVSSASFTIDMTAMSGASRARWWNPVTGAYTSIGSGYANSGTRTFTTPGSNGAGNDWVLVLDPGP